MLVEWAQLVVSPDASADAWLTAHSADALDDGVHFVEIDGPPLLSIKKITSWHLFINT